MARSPQHPTPGPDGEPHEQQPKWRRDFPIDQDRDEYIARRDFTRFMVLTSGAFVVGQGWIGLDQAMQPEREDWPEKEIASLDELEVGASRSFQYPDHEPCLLLRLDEQTLVAFNQQCTHLMCPVRPEFEHGRLECPCHDGYFDMRSGQPLAGPPRRPLPRIVLDVRDGVIYATGMELST